VALTWLNPFVPFRDLLGEYEALEELEDLLDVIDLTGKTKLGIPKSHLLSFLLEQYPYSLWHPVPQTSAVDPHFPSLPQHPPIVDASAGAPVVTMKVLTVERLLAGVTSAWTTSTIWRRPEGCDSRSGARK
jgi:hypothetical protein